MGVREKQLTGWREVRLGGETLYDSENSNGLGMGLDEGREVGWRMREKR